VTVTARPQDHHPRTLLVVVHAGQGLGFRLAGVEVEEVAPGEEEAALRAFRQRPGVGVVAIEEQVLAAAESPAHRRRREGRLPVVVPFTLPRRWAEPGRGRDLVAAIVRRAVGYHVKLGGVRP
jgi:vacuolar-type H+-ATPase subunit F/Vma7